MAKDKNKDFNSVKYKIFDGTDNIFDEKGSTFLAMRRVAWFSDGDAEPGEDKAKLELRKWKANENGVDSPMKGFAFLTDDGPHCLTEMLVDNGYGRTSKVLLSLKKRDDFEESVKHMYDEEDESGTEYFDARADLLEA